MSGSFVKVIIVGNLGADCEVRDLPNGGQVANFSVATSEKWTDKNTGENREKTEWHKIVAFGKLGEICGQYLRKGSKVLVEGKLETKEYTDKEGIKRYSTEVKISEMKMLDSAPANANQSAPQQQAQPQQGQKQQGYTGDFV